MTPEKNREPKSRPTTYAEAGVNVAEVKLRQSELARRFAVTYGLRRGKFGAVAEGIGHYAGLIDIGGGRLLALHVDGVGSKVIVAQMMNRYSTVGIDCIAMNVNDIICLGAEPVAFLDYLAVKEPNESLINEVTKGLAEGAKQASVAIVGGETAVLPDLLSGGPLAFDLAGMIVGVAEKSEIVTGAHIQPGDVIVGVESSGIHSNGLTLARRLLLTKYDVNEVVPPLKRGLGDELLEPTRIYVKPVLELVKKGVNLTGLAHITGGAFSKLSRLSREAKVGFNLDMMPEPPPVFQLLQREGGIARREMYNTFNMGVGFCVIARKGEDSSVIRVFKKYHLISNVIGHIVDKAGVYIPGERIA